MLAVVPNAMAQQEKIHVLVEYSLNCNIRTYQ